MADIIIILLIIAAVLWVVSYQKKTKAAVRKETQNGGSGNGSCSAGGVSCNGSCAGCSGCDLGRMGGTPIVQKETDMKERKIVFFDIDGTLVDGKTHMVPQSAVEAIQKLRQNGHLAFINTGRTLVSINQQIRDIGFDGYVCGCGMHIYHEGKEIYSYAIPKRKRLEIIKKLRELRITAFFEAPEAVWFDSRNPEKNERLEEAKEGFRSLGILIKDFPEDLEKADFTFDKFFCMLKEDSDVAALLAYVKDDFSATTQGEGNLEMVPKERSKAEGIRFLQKYFNIPSENCYAIGDSENDLPMLKAVPNSIAMGMCSKEILPFCSYQTDKVEEDGIAHALQHYGLI